MPLQIKNKIINTPIEDILYAIRVQTHNKYFNKIVRRSDNISIQCPNHNDGQEQKPSCSIYISDDGKIPYGTVHCFVCGYSTDFIGMVSDCLGMNRSDASDWLTDTFADTIISNTLYLPELELPKKSKESLPLDTSILEQYDYYHPYMWKRHLTKEIVDKFRIGFDKEKNAITFPLWDEKNNFIGITERSINSKKFYIPENLEKPVYLLNVCLYENVHCVYVVESQINCLTLWSWGYPSVALFGTGTDHQYEVLNKSGIKSFITAFDGDEAGYKGMKRFNKNIKNAFIQNLKLPQGKDVNDLSKIEFSYLDFWD